MFWLRLLVIILLTILEELFLLSDTNVPAFTLSAKDNQNLSTPTIKDLKDRYIGMNIKQNVRIKIRQITKYIFFNQTL